MSNQQEADKEIDMERMEAINDMAQDVRAFAIMTALNEGFKPSVMLSGIAVALVELNHDYSKGNDEDKAGSLEDMINVLRELHAHYGDAKRRQAIREAAEARERGDMQ